MTLTLTTLTREEALEAMLVGLNSLAAQLQEKIDETQQLLHGKPAAGKRTVSTATRSKMKAAWARRKKAAKAGKK